MWPPRSKYASFQVSAALFYVRTLTFVRAWIYTDDTRASRLQACKGRRSYLSQNIGPAVAWSAGPAPPPLDILRLYNFCWYREWCFANSHCCILPRYHSQWLVYTYQAQWIPAWFDFMCFTSIVTEINAGLHILRRIMQVCNPDNFKDMFSMSSAK